MIFALTVFTVDLYRTSLTTHFADVSVFCSAFLVMYIR